MHMLTGELPKEGEKLLVKIQMPLAGRRDMALVYDKSRTWQLFVPVEDVEEKMRGEDKRYFSAHIKNKELVIDDDAIEQTW